MPQQYQATYENAARAQKAIEALRLNFNNKKKPASKQPAYENLHPSPRPCGKNEVIAAITGLCDCCGKTQEQQNLLTKIDSGQLLCPDCLTELRPSPALS